jgi:hypothetical protein
VKNAFSLFCGACERPKAYRNTPSGTLFGAHIHVHLTFQLPDHFVACAGTPRSMCGHTRKSHFAYCRCQARVYLRHLIDPQRAISVHFFSLSPSNLHVERLSWRMSPHLRFCFLLVSKSVFTSCFMRASDVDLSNTLPTLKQSC